MNRLPRSLPRRLTAAVAPLVLTLALTGCGGSDGSDPGDSGSGGAAIPTAPAPTDEVTSEVTSEAPGSGDGAASGAPTDASAQDFCDALNAGPDALGDDDEQAADEIHSYGDALAAVGTPAEFTGDARAGFEVLVDFFATIDAADVDEFSSQGTPEDVLGAENGALATTFFTQAVQVCQQTLPTEGATPTEGAS